LERAGGIYQTAKFPTTLKKTFEFTKNSIWTSVELHSTCEDDLSYIAEWNLHFSNYDALLINNQKPDERMQLCCSKLIIKDNVLNKIFRFTFEKDIEIYLFKVKSISQSEAGVDYTTQGLSFGFKQNFSKDLKFKYCFKCL
jgi:hypothetical protein